MSFLCARHCIVGDGGDAVMSKEVPAVIQLPASWVQTNTRQHKYVSQVVNAYEGGRERTEFLYICQILKSSLRLP